MSTFKLTEVADPEVLAIATACGRIVEAAIDAGKPDEAFAAIRQAFDQLATLRHGPTADDPIGNLFSPKIEAILIAGGIESIGDLLQHSRVSLVQTFQIRYRSADIIDRKLEQIGFGGLRRD